MKITSVNNELIKETAKLLKNKYREETGLFLIEGKKSIQEAIDYGVEIIKIFSTEGFEDFSEHIETTEAVISKISDTKTPPKCVAVAKQPNYKLSDFKSKSKVILLEDIKDAGNLGTILRTAAAFGIDGIVLFGDTVDLFNPKTVRSAVGNLWKVPTVSVKSFDELEKIFSNFERIATLPAGDNTIPLKEYSPKEKTLLMFGSEADGLSEVLKSFATKNITIEMNPNVESLNLSVSAAVMMYKFV